MTTRSGDNLPYAVGLETEEIKFILYVRSQMKLIGRYK